MLRASGLKCEGMKNPIGIDICQPLLAWQLESDASNVIQTHYQLIVSDNINDIQNGMGNFFDTGKKQSNNNACKLEKSLKNSSKRYFWAVKVWDNNNEESEWSEIQLFESGLLSDLHWCAKWIEPFQRPVLEDGFIKLASFPQNYEEVMKNPYNKLLAENSKPVEERAFNPCPLIRKEFKIEKRVKSARAYATAHGIYSLELNGRRVGDLEFMPEITPYDKYLQYQTYEVTDLLCQGTNAVGAALSDGWWAGRIGVDGDSCNYGNALALLLQINIEYEDGTTEKIGTDSSFKSFEGPWRYADLFVGEKYDARLEQNGWSQAGFYELYWQNVTECNFAVNNLVGQNAEPIRVIKRIKPICILNSPNGETIVDFGQVISGNASFCIQGKTGRIIEFAYTEQLDKDGNFWADIIGYNNQHRDYYICSGKGEEKYEPRFTYRGFRYVRVAGYEGELNVNKIEARLIASDVSNIGSFVCSDERITRLQSNIQYTLISNLISIPTDNPDRERAGWTADAQMTAPTNNFNFNLQAFWKRWLKAYRLEQMPDGAVPMVIPYWKTYQLLRDIYCVACTGWGDACIILPWEAYQAYGDLDILTENYDMMAKWLGFVMTRAEEKNPEDIGELTPERKENLKYIWNGDFQWGDWLTPSGNVDENGNHIFTFPLDRFTPCFYTTYSAELMSKIAGILGKKYDAEYYRDLAEKIRKATVAEYFDNGFIMNSRFQGATILALKMGFIPEDKKNQAADRLLELIRKNGGKMDTGFSSTQHILDVLVDIGNIETAYDILLGEEMPSWLYEIKKGATSIWESFDNISPEGGLRPLSYIQNANGCVGDWLYRVIAGINRKEPGYKKTLIAPVLDPKRRITSAEAKINTPYGDVASKWSIENEVMRLTISIPANTQAEVRLPCKKTLKGISAALNSGHIRDDNTVSVQVGSGLYIFEYRLE